MVIFKPFQLIGSVSVKSLRDKLQKAMKTKDKRLLDSAIRETVVAGIPELETDLQQARNMSDILSGGSGGQHLD